MGLSIELRVLAPVAVQLLLAPLWFVPGLAAAGFATVQAVLLALVFPAYLSFLGVQWIANAPPRRWPAAALLLAVVLLMLVSGGYLLWGLSTGMLRRPDVVTLIIVEAETVFGAAIIFVPVCVSMLLRLVRSAKQTA